MSQLRDGQALLRADAPANMVPLLQETSLSVAALLLRSVQVMEQDQQVRFARLGVFAPKPATIDLRRMAAVWQDGIETAAVNATDLVDHGIQSRSRKSAQARVAPTRGNRAGACTRTPPRTRGRAHS
jgi:hypothetical protein